MILPPEREKISKYFTVYEAFYLPRWIRLANEEDGLTEEIFETVRRFLRNHIDPVREFINSEMIVHCCYRPPAYNKLVKGAKNSAHLACDGSAAIDFHFYNFGCSYARAMLLPKLNDFDLRMENNQGGWIHLDSKPVPPGGSRFFLP